MRRGRVGVLKLIAANAACLSQLQTSFWTAIAIKRQSCSVMPQAVSGGSRAHGQEIHAAACVGDRRECPTTVSLLPALLPGCGWTSVSMPLPFSRPAFTERVRPAGCLVDALRGASGRDRAPHGGPDHAPAAGTNLDTASRAVAAQAAA